MDMTTATAINTRISSGFILYQVPTTTHNSTLQLRQLQYLSNFNKYLLTYDIFSIMLPLIRQRKELAVENRRTIMHASTLLVLLLLSSGCFYMLLELFGYTFVPANGLLLDINTGAVIVLLTIIGIKQRREMSKSSALFAAVLLPIAIFFYISKDAHIGINQINAYAHILLTCLTLLCSLLLFFFLVRVKAVKIGLGIVYSVLTVLMLFLLCIQSFCVLFNANSVVRSEMSPNSIFIAEVIQNDQGALGGSTYVSVARLDREINLFIGKIREYPEMIYVGRWSAAFAMTLWWETDEILRINEISIPFHKDNRISSYGRRHPFLSNPFRQFLFY